MKNIGGNYFDKHHSKNPLVKLLMWNFHRVLFRFLTKTKVGSILDVGCGEGYTTQRIASELRIPIDGIELERDIVEKAREINPNISFEVGSAHEIPREDFTYDLVLFTEVLEHVENPGSAVLELKRVSRQFVLISVPNEPWWRLANMLRLRYLRDLGNTPGHINHWTRGQLKEFLSPKFKKVMVKNALLWNVALCIKDEKQ